jgi:nitroimidazol reductase NimA-like FMN-containing flavoprotein (pyridoxamine 5'-phosphate oxidase superfamily)
MRRDEREITDRKTIDGIIARCRVCRLALCDDGQPYVIPLHFGYDGRCLYFHAALEGKKIDILRRNDRVAFAFDILHGIVPGEHACDWGSRYESVVGSGRAEIVEDAEARKAALACIMRQYGSDTIDFSESVLARTLILRVRIAALSGKAR